MMIVEDEQLILNLMKIVIERNKQLTIVGCFTNPLQALAELPSLKPDVAFLDIEMPEMMGLELAEKVLEADEDIQIVFTTAYEQYAIEAFKVPAVDYILKPITPEEIERVTNRLLKNHNHMRVIKDKTSQNQKESIFCLGTFEIRNEKQVVIKFPTRKTEELLAYFLIHPNQVVSKWRLTELLWADIDGHRSIQNLYNTIYRLKKTLKEHSKWITLKKVNEGYMLDMSNVKSDVDEFREYLQYHSASAISEENLVESERVFKLYKGPLFGLKDYIWKIGLEEQLEKQYSSLTRQIAHYYYSKGEFDEAEKILKTFLSLYPLHDKLNLMLLKLYSSDLDELNRLRSYYDDYVKLLKKELGATPPLETQHFMRRFK
ncbi:response regulator [Chengkuizengella sp. SCS-71B]|uniref:response regulator n=1 Tax=Chengkuizengella sp. SCS-71B TaxID=3115290 RepID=UPI0032C23886